VIRPRSFVRESSGFVSRLLLFYWLGSAALITLLLAGVRCVEKHQRSLLMAENAINLVESTLATSTSAKNRQALIEASATSSIGNGEIGLHSLLVLNRDGKIVNSSRPAWLGVMIYDGIFRGSGFNNPNFREIADCLRNSRPDCVSLSSDQFPSLGRGFTVYRSVFKPSAALGLPREPFIVVATTYSDSIEHTSLLLEVLPLLVLALAVAALLSAVIWLSMRTLLLPRLSLAAQTDGLTQLINRTAFMESAMEVLADSEEAGLPLVFAILDVDHFKRINDSYGHDCGDAALVSVAAVLATVMRGDDLVCRFGGEEFAVLMATDEQAGRKVMERLRLQLEMNRIAYAGREIPVTVSIGAAATSESGYNIDYLYTSADRALYAAKQAGRNRVEWASSRSVGRLQLSPPIQDPPHSQERSLELPAPPD
jgi:diguanylate cyclase (GGDEF)-like protein